MITKGNYYKRLLHTDIYQYFEYAVLHFLFEEVLQSYLLWFH